MSLVEQGYYSNIGEPLLELRLLGREGEPILLDALVDTGFNRSLLIFRSEAKQAHLPPTRNVADPIYLADGGRQLATSTFGYVKWFGQTTELEILVVPSDRGARDRCLIGMELLRGKDILLGLSDFQIRIA